MNSQDRFVALLSRKSFFNVIPISVLFSSIIMSALALRGHIDIFDGILVVVLGSASRINGWLSGIKDCSSAVLEALKSDNKTR